MSDWVNELYGHSEMIADSRLSIEEFSNRFTRNFYERKLYMGAEPSLQNLASDIYILSQYHFEVETLSSLDFSRRLVAILKKYSTLDQFEKGTFNA